MTVTKIMIFESLVRSHHFVLQSQATAQINKKRGGLLHLYILLGQMMMIYMFLSIDIISPISDEPSYGDFLSYSSYGHQEMKASGSI